MNVMQTKNTMFDHRVQPIVPTTAVKKPEKFQNFFFRQKILEQFLLE
jgi:hypothetical protein